jgi:4-oxalocrotonate tautomerase
LTWYLPSGYHIPYEEKVNFRRLLMPVVIVEMWAGRTPEQKKTLVEGITDVFAKLGTAPEATQVILHDNAKTNWAIAGKLCE